MSEYLVPSVAEAARSDEAVSRGDPGVARWLRALEFLALEAGLDTAAEDIRSAASGATGGEVEVETPSTIGEALFTLGDDWPSIYRRKAAIS